MTANPNELQPTPVKAWKQKLTEVIELPSGNYLKVRKIGLQTLMTTGRIPNSLMSIMKKAVDKGVGMEAEAAIEIAEDEKTLRELGEFMNHVTAMVAIEPQIYPVPKNEADRNEELLYVDEVDEEDKSFIFAWVTGGVKDVESFREQTRAGMVVVPGREDLELPAQ